MSEVFEGVVCNGPAHRVGRIAQRFSRSLCLDVVEMPGPVAVVYRNDPRSMSVFTHGIDELAAAISAECCPALLVRYDSSVGHRSSRLYLDGHLKRDFTDRDELFVPLDEAGLPVTSQPQLKFAELAPDKEYETIQNAVELGLASLGRGQWSDLKRLMGRV
jgi:hypothetical protein